MHVAVINYKKGFRYEKFIAQFNCFSKRKEKEGRGGDSRDWTINEKYYVK